MGIWNHINIDSNDSYKFHSSADSKPPEGAKDIKACGCYTTYDRKDSERVFSYKTTSYTTYHYCEEHMKKVQKAKEETVERLKKEMKENMKRVEKEREENMKRLKEEAKEKEESEKIWKVRCTKVGLASDVEINWLIKTMHELKLLRLKEIKQLSLLTESGWFVRICRGEVTLTFRGTHSQFCPVQEDELNCPHLENRRCICVPRIYLVFHYSRCKPGNRYIFSLQKYSGAQVAGIKSRNILINLMRGLRLTDLKELENIKLFCDSSPWRYVIENDEHVKVIFNLAHCGSCPCESEPRCACNYRCPCKSELWGSAKIYMLFKITNDGELFSFNLAN